MKAHDRRVPELDGVRGTAILMVLVWHYFNSQIHPHPHSWLGKIAVPFGLFWSGVDLFFVLSGFLIGGILVDSAEATNYFRVFYVRRVCRLGPVYALLMLSFGIAYLLCDAHGRFAWLLANPLPAGAYLTFTQNVFMGLSGTFGANWAAPTWSLAVEEQFYSVLPILVLLLPRRALHWVLLVAIGAAPLLRGQVSAIVAQIETPMRSDSLLMGVMAALAVRSESLLQALRSRRREFAVTFVILLSGAGVMCVRSDWLGVYLQTWLAALYTALILTPFVDPDSFVSRCLRSRVLRFFGTISYSLYLIHQIVTGLLHGLVYGREPRIENLASAALTLASLAVSVAVAYALYLGIEKRAVAYGRRHAYAIGAASHTETQPVSVG